MAARKKEEECLRLVRITDILAVNVASLPYNNLGPANCSEKHLVARFHDQQRTVRIEYQPCSDPLQGRQRPHRSDTGVKSDPRKYVHFEAGTQCLLNGSDSGSYANSVKLNHDKGTKPLFAAIASTACHDVV